MITYIIRRLLLVPILLFGVSILIFGMLQFLDPVERASLYVRGKFPNRGTDICSCQTLLPRLPDLQAIYELAGRRDQPCQRGT